MKEVPRGRIDLNQTLSWHRSGKSDPTSREAPGEFVKAFRTPDGPVTLYVQQLPRAWRFQAWGAGRDWILDRADQLLQPTDPPLPRHHPLVEQLDRARGGLRVTRTPWIEDLVVATILQQRVQTRDAFRAFGQLARLRPEPAPGPFTLLLAPRVYRVATPAHLAQLGVEEKRGSTLLRLHALEKRLERAYDATHEEVRCWLQSVRGIGPWTCESVMGLGMGDPDALPTGDLHYPHTISERLTGYRWSSDQEMEQHLEPYRGVRFRVLRLLVSS